MDRDVAEEIGVEDQRVRRCRAGRARRSSGAQLLPGRTGATESRRRLSAMPSRPDGGGVPRARAERARSAVSGPMPVRSTPLRRELRVHQHVRERRGLRRRVPAVDVERRRPLRRSLPPASRQAPARTPRHPRARSGCEFVVLFTTPRNPRIAIAGIVSRTRLKIGTPSMTAPSNRNDTPAARRPIAEPAIRERRRTLVRGYGMTPGVDRSFDVAMAGWPSAIAGVVVSMSDAQRRCARPQRVDHVSRRVDEAIAAWQRDGPPRRSRSAARRRCRPGRERRAMPACRDADDAAVRDRRSRGSQRAPLGDAASRTGGRHCRIRPARDRRASARCVGAVRPRCRAPRRRVRARQSAARGRSRTRSAGSRPSRSDRRARPGRSARRECARSAPSIRSGTIADERDGARLGRNVTEEGRPPFDPAAQDRIVGAQDAARPGEQQLAARSATARYGRADR